MKKLIVITALFYSCFMQAQVITPELADSLQKILDASLDTYHVKGASASLLTDEDQWTGVSGVSYDTVSIYPEMLFGIGSITKNFVATVVLQLYEEGMFKLSDSIYNYVQAFNNVDSTITIRQLLNHTSGVFDFLDNPDAIDSLNVTGSKTYTAEEVISMWTLEPYFPPGTGFHYSNTNYLLLGLIIEEVTGNLVSYEIHNRLTDPLGMGSTFLFPEEGYSGERSHVWIWLGSGGFVDTTAYCDTTLYSASWTSGAILSTAGQMVKYSKSLYEDNLLNDTTLGLMLEPGPFNLGYALGTTFLQHHGYTFYGHTGDIGYTASMFYNPDYSVSIAVTFNTRRQGSSSVLVDLFDKYTEMIVGVKELEDVNILVYPNPCEDILHIRLNEDIRGEPVQVNMMDTMGRVLDVFTFQADHSEQLDLKMDLSSYASGIYLIQVLMDMKTYSRKIIKK